MMTREEAIAFAESEQWKGLTEKQRACLQLSEDCLCMPFGVFHAAVESALGRPVWTHEFANRESLVAELSGTIGPATMADVMKKAEDMVGNGRVVTVAV